MIRFFKYLRETVEKDPDRPAVVDRDGMRTTTYGQLYESALKVKDWLLKSGIGREDVTAIYFPKGIAQEYGIYDKISEGTYGFIGQYYSPHRLQDCLQGEMKNLLLLRRLE